MMMAVGRARIQEFARSGDPPEECDEGRPAQHLYVEAMWAHVRLEELLVYLRPYITPTDGKPTVNCFRHRELFNTVSTTPAA